MAHGLRILRQFEGQTKASRCRHKPVCRAPGLSPCHTVPLSPPPSSHLLPPPSPFSLCLSLRQRYLPAVFKPLFRTKNTLDWSLLRCYTQACTWTVDLCYEGKPVHLFVHKFHCEPFRDRLYDVNWHLTLNSVWFRYIQRFLATVCTINSLLILCYVVAQIVFTIQ
jgi:hypothetical protein